MSVVPLGGSFVTEPAAMTLAAILLRDGYFRVAGHTRFKYLALGVLFVNVSIGGVLTAYAAPPVLMVASTFGWDTAFMAEHRSEEHTSELQSLMRISYAVFCLKKKNNNNHHPNT